MIKHADEEQKTLGTTASKRPGVDPDDQTLSKGM